MHRSPPGKYFSDYLTCVKNEGNGRNDFYRQTVINKSAITMNVRAAVKYFTVRRFVGSNK